MAYARAVAILVVLSGIVAEGRRSSHCTDHDWTKCSDNGDDCCITDDGSEAYSCNDGYKVVETSRKCGGWIPGTREYSCVHSWSSCSEWYDENNHEYHDCDVGQEEEEEWWAKMLTGTVVACVVATILIILASMPVCCGVMKENQGALNGIGCCVGLFGVFTMFIPLIAALAATNEAVDDHCNKCHCSDEDREKAKEVFGFWGAIIGYVYGFGWLAVALGITAEVLVCCMCCACCGPLKTYREQQKMGGVPGQPQMQMQQVPGVVVGAPAPVQPC